jgi:formylglycine-generating enzyme required for sulfatase activity
MAAACILFADIVGFSNKRTSLQREIIESFNKELRTFLMQFMDPFTGESEVIALPTGDGAALSFLVDKEDRKWNDRTVFGLCIGLHKWAYDISTPENPVQLRLGVHMGVVDVVMDLNNKKNVVGDTVNFTARVMSAAQACQTLISDTVFNQYVGVAAKSMQVENKGNTYTILFSKPIKHLAKHERELTVYEMLLDHPEPFIYSPENVAHAKPAIEHKEFEPEMITVNGGKFLMGNKEGNKSEKPVHEVELTGFQIAKYPVTQREWRAVMGNNPSKNKDKDNHPVERVSWEDAQEYVKKLNELTGRHYRLPTEAEWEYAARGGEKSMGYKFAGSNELKNVAWESENAKGSTQPVGQKKPNELGIYDMCGNVWEWCYDWFDEKYYSKSPAQDPQGPDTGDNKVIRGGSWINFPAYYQVSDRYYNHPSEKRIWLGFRVVCPLE